MFNWFGKKIEERPAILEKEPGVIGGRIERLQRRCAESLSRKTENWSVRRWKLSLLLFCVLFGGASIYIMTGSVKGKVNTSGLNIIRPRIPIDSANPNRPTVPSAYTITDKEYYELQVFKQYFDSLNTSEQGRRIRDSLLKARPGLMDTVRLIEQLYLSQKK